MPIGSDLINLAGPRSWDRKLHDRFPQSEYEWLTFDQSHEYETSDGLHLVRTEADDVSRSVVHQLQGLHVSSSGAVTMAAAPAVGQPHN
jgi:hypothetical protein